MGTLLHSCAEVRAAIELSFGVVSGVVCPYWPNGFNGVIFNRNVFDLCVKS